MLKKIRSLAIVFALFVFFSLALVSTAYADNVYGVFRYNVGAITAVKWFPTQEAAEAWLEDAYANPYFSSNYADDIYIILPATSSSAKVSSLTR